MQLADVSLESELETVRGARERRLRAGRRHAIVAMVDLGDLREGMMPAALPAFLERVNAMDHIDIAGIGVNLTCYGAIVPDEDNLGRLAELAARVEKQLGRPLRWVSGGNSGSIGMVTSGRMPAAVDTLRIGETILLGVDTLTREPALGLHLDAITVSAPVIECFVKPSLPQGTSAQDAFGNFPTFTDRGERRRAICALGRQDAPPEGLAPARPARRGAGRLQRPPHPRRRRPGPPAGPRRAPQLHAHLRCDTAAVHVTVRPQSVHSAGLTQGSWRGGTCNHRSEHGQREPKS